MKAVVMTSVMDRLTFVCGLTLGNGNRGRNYFGHTECNEVVSRGGGADRSLVRGSPLPTSQGAPRVRRGCPQHCGALRWSRRPRRSSVTRLWNVADRHGILWVVVPRDAVVDRDGCALCIRVH